MKDGSDDAEIDWRPYEDLSSYKDEVEALVAPPTNIQAAPRPAAKNRLAENPGQPRKPPRTFSLATPEPRGW